MNTTRTVLVVDDEPVVMKLARRVLAREGYHILEATTAEEAFALAKAHQGPIHLLITNHVLQNFRGREIAERIGAAHPRMKVMHISGHLPRTLEQDGSLTPGAAFLQKPFLPKTLSDAVRALLAEPSGPAS